MKKLRQYSLVKAQESSDPNWEAVSDSKPTDIFIFFGEIPNMPGHCIVLNQRTQKYLIGFHTERFVELTKEET
jgi:hypothetical protein